MVVHGHQRAASSSRKLYLLNVWTRDKCSNKRELPCQYILFSLTKLWQPQKYEGKDSIKAHLVMFSVAHFPESEYCKVGSKQMLSCQTEEQKVKFDPNLGVLVIADQFIVSFANLVHQGIADQCC